MNTTVPQLRPKLREYQLAGVDELMKKLTTNRSHGALLADACGLGKTCQAIEVANRILKHESPKTLLIVCPSSLRLNWWRELETWLDSGGVYLEVLTYGEIVRAHQRLDRYTLIVFDEAHYLKSETAKRTKACLALDAKYRLFLSGTPCLNRPMELYNILHNLGLKLTRKAYGFRYCSGRLFRVPIRGGHGFRKAFDFSGASNLDELNAALRANVMVRRTKEEVLTELPPKVRQVISVKFSSGESAAFRARFDSLSEAADILKEVQRIPFEELARERYNVALKKLPYIEEFINDLLEEEDKLVVFCHHRDLIERIVAAGPDRVALMGGMSEREKDAAVQAFQQGPARVFVGQIQAAGVGLTLTAASTVLFGELSWVPGDMNQCEDRCHRIGQRDTVRVFHLVADGSIDSRLVNALVEKQRVLEEVLA